MAKIDDSVKKKDPELRFKGFTDEWDERKLSDIADRFDNLRVPITASDRKPGDTPYYGANGIQDYVEGFTHNGEFILVAEDGANDLKNYPVQYVNGKVWVNNHAHVLQGKKTITDNKFLMNAIKNFNIEPFLVGGGRAKLNADVMMKLNILLPTIVEQEKIGAFFKKIDDTITLHQRKLDLLKEQKKGFLQKMFPKNGAKVPELRFAGFADDWEERKLGDYIIQYSEKTKQNNQYPVFTSSRNGLFFQKDYYKGNQIASEDNTGYNIVPRGYFTYRHMSDDLVFKFNINDLADYGIVSTLYPVFTTNEQLDSKYLQYQLNEGSEFRRFSLLQKQGGSRTYMYLNKLQNMILTIPKLEEQQKIGSFFKQLDETIDLHQRKVDLLTDLKKGLLQQMFV